MKVEILKSVTHSGVDLRVGSVVDMEESDGLRLIKMDMAVWVSDGEKVTGDRLQVTSDEVTSDTSKKGEEFTDFLEEAKTMDAETLRYNLEKFTKVMLCQDLSILGVSYRPEMSKGMLIGLYMKAMGKTE